MLPCFTKTRSGIFVARDRRIRECALLSCGRWRGNSRGNCADRAGSRARLGPIITVMQVLSSEFRHVATGVTDGPAALKPLPD